MMRQWVRAAGRLRQTWLGLAFLTTLLLEEDRDLGGGWTGGRREEAFLLCARLKTALRAALPLHTARLYHLATLPRAPLPGMRFCASLLFPPPTRFHATPSASTSPLLLLCARAWPLQAGEVLMPCKQFLSISSLATLCHPSLSSLLSLGYSSLSSLHTTYCSLSCCLCFLTLGINICMYGRGHGGMAVCSGSRQQRHAGTLKLLCCLPRTTPCHLP